MDIRGKHILKAQVKSSLIFQSYFRLKLNSLPRYINHLLSLKIFLGSAYHWHLAQSNCGLNYHLAVKTYPPTPKDKNLNILLSVLYCLYCECFIFESHSLFDSKTHFLFLSRDYFLKTSPLWKNDVIIEDAYFVFLFYLIGCLNGNREWKFHLAIR